MYKILRDESSETLASDVIGVMWEIVDFYQDKATYDKSSAPATRGQRAIYACTWYLCEVENGGHDQFFFNSTGMVWQDALDGLKLIGAEPFLEIYQQALACFPESTPSFDRTERTEQLNSIEPGVLDVLDNPVYDFVGGLEPYFNKYIQENPEEFFLD
jgi:hypothetical protein